MWKSLVKRILSKAGFEVSRLKPSFGDLMRRHDIRTVLDVGANEGQYGRSIRDAGYRNRIISFEPISTVYAELQANSTADSMWDTYPLALGETEGDKTISVSVKSVFSSFKQPSSYSVERLPGSRTARQETVRVARLDSFIEAHSIDLRHTYLKVDTQGFEKEVLLGAGTALCGIRAVQLELALRQLYSGQVGWIDMIKWMESQGFKVALAKENGFDLEECELLELDVVFVKNS
jgi:FkbM family methyltransferase